MSNDAILIVSGIAILLIIRWILKGKIAPGGDWDFDSDDSDSSDSGDD